MNVPNEVTLALMVGPAGSGKSTGVDYLNTAVYPEASVVSPDAIRLGMFGVQFKKEVEPLVWMQVRTLIVNELSIGRNVIVDATSLTRARRKAMLKLADHVERITGHKVYRKAYYFMLPLDEIQKRNASRDNPVPAGIVARQYEDYELPTEVEGFDALYKHDEVPGDNVVFIEVYKKKV